MIKYENVTIKYRRKIVCENVSFCAENGKITVLLGRNGSGKTSLLKAAIGLIPYSGKITNDGEIAYMPQILPDTDMTVEELVQCGKSKPTQLFKILTDEEKADCRRILEETELAQYADIPVSELSGGERQRAFFAMILARDASTVILDEPTANLDSEYKEMVYDFAKKLKEKDLAVLMVLHHQGEAKRISDYIFNLKETSVLCTKE